MSGSGAMALTGVALAVVAVVLSFAANNFAIGPTRSHYARLGWVAFTLAIVGLTSAAWIEALR
ncbi:hypothetical protein NOK12_16830 [Nocardioides sp. OK12]|nr:hypothetical protein NOK12_16830 [Nocardioides sp. OK12]